MPFTPRDIARLSGCSLSTVNRHLHDCFPTHAEGAWWRFEETEAARIIAELRAAKRACHTYPRRTTRAQRSC